MCSKTITHKAQHNTTIIIVITVIIDSKTLVWLSSVCFLRQQKFTNYRIERTLAGINIIIVWGLQFCDLQLLILCVCSVCVQ